MVHLLIFRYLATSHCMSWLYYKPFHLICWITLTSYHSICCLLFATYELRGQKDVKSSQYVQPDLVLRYLLMPYVRSSFNPLITARQQLLKKLKLWRKSIQPIAQHLVQMSVWLGPSRRPQCVTVQHNRKCLRNVIRLSVLERVL